MRTALAFGAMFTATQASAHPGLHVHGDSGSSLGLVAGALAVVALAGVLAWARGARA